MKWHDIIAKPLAEFITSTLFVTLVMLIFMGGIVTHLAVVFDSWFLAIGFQCVVIISTVNANILPKFTLSTKYVSGKGRIPDKTLPAIAVIMSIFMFWFISIAFNIIDAFANGTWYDIVIILTKALAIAAMELMFSYLFTSRWAEDLKRFAEIDNELSNIIVDIETKPDTVEIIETKHPSKPGIIETKSNDAGYI